ncbi:hypothetical protein WEH80_26910 [Actinomycetes bacterium KLBMP 9759]
MGRPARYRLRRAEALADICGYVIDHGDVPECSGRAALADVLVPLQELERRARTVMLDFGGWISPADLRMLSCDAAVIPIVTGRKRQPL